jgi:hypothetical protein
VTPVQRHDEGGLDSPWALSRRRRRRHRPSAPPASPRWFCDTLGVCTRWNGGPRAPSRMLCAASATALSPEEQTLLTVVQTTDDGRPAASAACFVGACARTGAPTGVGALARVMHRHAGPRRCSPCKYLPVDEDALHHPSLATRR